MSDAALRLIQREAIEAERCRTFDLWCGACLWCRTLHAFRELEEPTV